MRTPAAREARRRWHDELAAVEREHRQPEAFIVRATRDSITAPAS
jgi:hypothetical protein